MSVDEFITYCTVAGAIRKHTTIGRHWSTEKGAKDIFVLEGVIGVTDFWIKYYTLADSTEKVFIDGRASHAHSVFGPMSTEVWGIDSLIREIEMDT